MTRRNFLKGVAAAGVASALPMGAIAPLTQGCTPSGKARGWDFDEIVDRSGTWSIKYSQGGDKLPMWIADMDFRTDPAVATALRERLERDAFGYTRTPDEYREAIRGWQERENGWPIPCEWINYAPGVIAGINQAYLTFTRPGDRIIVQPPVYDLFRSYALRLGREVVFNPMIFEGDTYRMDFEGLERLFDNRTKVLVLCNPHNPCGILWDRETLVRLAEICARHGVIVISDEIHADLALYGRRHIPFCSVSDTAARIGLIFSGPSKSFNLAGITGTAYCIIPNGALREKYIATIENTKLAEPSIPTLIGTIAAYTSQSGWLPALKKYLAGNVDLVMDFFARNDLGIKAVRPEASFLVWLDCRSLGLSQKELLARFEDGAGVIMTDGEFFGTGGTGFVRLNIGCPRSMVENALSRIKKEFA
ncbi:MAG: pyridoxal phosphate-dependent aminotransferase [Bacteroidales bacterium]|nr:pyridoxal phosphate-dependent aminotransferase [Bacteroidales bacterium]